MKFWWASQGKNYPDVIDGGTLWTSGQVDGGLKRDRKRLFELLPGDVVFHYYGPYLSAVSVVDTAWVDAPRPSGYDGPDDGWLVTVNTLVKGLKIHFNRIAELLPSGAPGPLDKNGTPAQKYLSPLTFDEAQALLGEVNLTTPLVPEAAGTALAASVSPARGDTDALVTTGRRVEQTALRQRLLSAGHQCALCGRELPSQLLVAAHIKPRALCSEAERWDFDGVAMLTCALGCDALFEYRYIFVDPDGYIAAGNKAATDPLKRTVHALVGKPCLAFDGARSTAFASHRALVEK